MATEKLATQDVIDACEATPAAQRNAGERYILCLNDAQGISQVDTFIKRMAKTDYKLSKLDVELLHALAIFSDDTAPEPASANAPSTGTRMARRTLLGGLAGLAVYPLGRATKVIPNPESGDEDPRAFGFRTAVGGAAGAALGAVTTPGNPNAAGSPIPTDPVGYFLHRLNGAIEAQLPGIPR